MQDAAPPTAFVSVTRLRLRSFRFLPGFFLHAIRSQRQLRAAPGFQSGSLLADRHLTFWTMTLWPDEASMRGYMLAGAHRQAMQRLAGWCDEASVVHWVQQLTTLPPWSEADSRMREHGRPSRVRTPSPTHQTLGYRPPRLSRAAALTRKHP